MDNQKPNSRMHYGLKKSASTCRGTTLAPLVISLAIAALASIAFLNQGAALGERKNLIKAPDEVFGYIKEWVNLRGQKQNHFQITPAEMSFHNSRNVFGYLVTYEQGNSGKKSSFTYQTATTNQCIELKKLLEKYKNTIIKITCTNSDLLIQFQR